MFFERICSHMSDLLIATFEQVVMWKLVMKHTLINRTHPYLAFLECSIPTTTFYPYRIGNIALREPTYYTVLIISIYIHISHPRWMLER